MKLKRLISYVEELFPRAFAEEKDNTGLQVGDLDSEVKKVLITLEANSDAIEYAAKNKYDLIIARKHELFIDDNASKLLRESERALRRRRRRVQGGIGSVVVLALAAVFFLLSALGARRDLVNTQAETTRAGETAAAANALSADSLATTTAILASFATGNISAIIIAFAHFLFNLTGTVFIYPIKLFRMVPISLAKAFGNLAATKRRYAFIYVICVFFLIPTLLIIVSKLF